MLYFIIVYFFLWFVELSFVIGVFRLIGLFCVGFVMLKVIFFGVSVSVCFVVYNFFGLFIFFIFNWILYNKIIKYLYILKEIVKKNLIRIKKFNFF